MSCCRPTAALAPTPRSAPAPASCTRGQGCPAAQPAWPCRSRSPGRPAGDLRHARRPVHHPRPLCLPHALQPGRGAGGSGRRHRATARRSRPDHRRIWQRFADHFYLFRGTPTGLWLADELIERLRREREADRRERPAHLRPPGGATGPARSSRRAPCSSASTSSCSAPPTPPPSRSSDHRPLHAAGWGTTGAAHLPARRRGQPEQLRLARDISTALSAVSGIDVVDYASLHPRAGGSAAPRSRHLGATGDRPRRADAATPSASSDRRGRRASSSAPCAARPRPTTRRASPAHMLMELARMSAEDGLVMQLHAGSFRDHNTALFERFGPDKGADIPVADRMDAQPAAAAQRLRQRPALPPDPVYPGREHLQPRAGAAGRALSRRAAGAALVVLRQRQRHAPLPRRGGGDGRALQSRRASTTTRAPSASIPARHDVWRRVSCDWLAGQVVRGLIDLDDAREMALDCAYGLARRAYRLD